MTLPLRLFCLVCLFCSAVATATEVVVTQPFVDVHSGPAKEFPVFHVLEKGQQVTVLKARTGWYKIETIAGIEGWIASDSLLEMQDLAGSDVQLNSGDFKQYQQRTVEIGVFGGRLDAVNILSVSAAWMWTDNLTAEVSFSQALGDYSENRLWIVRMQHDTFPEWRLSPYVSLGAGQIQTTPLGTLIQSGGETRTSDVLEVGIGARYYLMRNFATRLEYKRLTALTQRDEFEELNLWQLGFTLSF